MNSKKLIRLVMAALFAALVFVGTFYLHVTLPYGYFNFGDAFLLLAAWIVGGWYGAAAGGIGAAAADLALGYTVYAPVTLVLKALMALAAAGIAGATARGGKRLAVAGLWIGAVAAELLMAGGYYLFEGFLYGFGAALASVPGNLLQGAAAVVSAGVVMSVLQPTGCLNRLGLSR